MMSSSEEHLFFLVIAVSFVVVAVGIKVFFTGKEIRTDGKNEKKIEKIADGNKTMGIGLAVVVVGVVVFILKQNILEYFLTLFIP